MKNSKKHLSLLLKDLPLINKKTGYTIYADKENTNDKSAFCIKMFCPKITVRASSVNIKIFSPTNSFSKKNKKAAKAKSVACGTKKARTKKANIAIGLTISLAEACRLK